MFDGLAGIDLSRYLLAIGVVGLGLLCLFGVLWVIRKKPSSPFVRGGRARQPRLAVVDATAVDTRRRLVLVRRDNVEHLIMIGGPTDIVIESRIVEDIDTKPIAAELPFDQSAALPKSESALELPAPPLSVTEQPSSASVQAQSAPPLKAKMWPTEPKKASEPASAEASDVKAAAEALAFQPPVQAKTAPEPLVKLDRIATPDRGPTSANLASNLAFAKSEAAQKETDLEIRNPYLEAETAAPAPVRSERPATPAPVSALHSWLRPAKVDTVPPTAASEPAAPASAKIVPLALQPLTPKPFEAKPAVRTPIDVDSLISSDFLDNARSRVLDTPEPPAMTPDVSPPNTAYPEQVEKHDATAEAPSPFARILDDEIKSGLPESRFDTPKVDPFLADIANLGSANSASSTNIEPSPAPTSGIDAQQVKTIADILDGARARVLEPEPITVAPPVATETMAPPDATDASKKEPADAADLISDAFAIEFEKLWESNALEADPIIVLDKAPEAAHRAPDVRLEPSTPSLNPKASDRPVDPELSLDDEMARVLGEFTATRKN